MVRAISRSLVRGCLAPLFGMGGFRGSFRCDQVRSAQKHTFRNLLAFSTIYPNIREFPLPGPISSRTCISLKINNNWAGLAFGNRPAFVSTRGSGT
jgi:hypothetical protein